MFAQQNQKQLHIYKMKDCQKRTDYPWITKTAQAIEGRSKCHTSSSRVKKKGPLSQRLKGRLVPLIIITATIYSAVTQPCRYKGALQLTNSGASIIEQIDLKQCINLMD